MIDINKQIAHWQQGAQEDLEVARNLVLQGKIRHGLFFAHLALEKQLKSLVCKQTGQLAPPIHNLVRLAEKAGVSLRDEQLDLLADVNEFNIEGRYPELLLPSPSNEEAQHYMEKILEMLECLNNP